MIPDTIMSILQKHGLEPLVFEPGSTPTAADAARMIGVQEGQIAKSILMKGKDGVFRMFVIAGDKRISSGKLKQLTGVKQSMASAEETLAATGFSPGGVCPFAAEGIEIFIDDSLADYDVVYPAAGDDASGVPVTWKKLLEITGGSRCDIIMDS